MGGLGLLGVSETVQYMRGCIISHSHKMEDNTMEGMELYLSLSHNSHVKCKVREVTLACTNVETDKHHITHTSHHTALPNGMT